MVVSHLLKLSSLCNWYIYTQYVHQTGCIQHSIVHFLSTIVTDLFKWYSYMLVSRVKDIEHEGVKGFRLWWQSTIFLVVFCCHIDSHAVYFSSIIQSQSIFKVSRQVAKITYSEWNVCIYLEICLLCDPSFIQSIDCIDIADRKVSKPTKHPIWTI